MSKLHSTLWIMGAILLSAAGLAAFFILFIPDFNVYWLIVSPLVIAVYQIPAVVFFYFYKKKKRKTVEQDIEDGGEDQESSPQKD